jgi:hypothetical protein
MTDKLFDDFVKSKLEQHDSGAPMHVWERIKADKDRKPKGFFLWRKTYSLLLAGLFISGSVLYFSLSQKNTSVSANEANVSPIKNETNQQQTKKQPTISETNTTASVPTITETNNEATISPTSVSATSNLHQSDKKNDAGNLKQKIKKHSASISQSGNTSLASNIKVKYHPVAILSSSSSSSASSSSLSNKAVDDIKNEQTISFVPFTLNRKALDAFKIGAVAMPQNKPSCPTINGPRRRDLYLETYFSPDYNVRSLSTSGTLNSYVVERNATENYRTSFSAGIRVVKNLGEKTLLKGGINYTQINERLRIITENSKQLTQIITIRTVVRSPGDTLFVRDTMFYEQSGTRYRTTYNRFRFIDVPLIFSYEFGNPELMHFAVNAGPVFNIVSFYSGEVMDTTYRPLPISTKSGSNANNWRSNIGMGVFASVSIYKKLNERIHLFGEPYVRYNLNPVTQQGNFVKQRYMVTGMQLGIRYNLIPPGQRYKR